MRRSKRQKRDPFAPTADIGGRPHPTPGGVRYTIRRPRLFRDERAPGEHERLGIMGPPEEDPDGEE